MKKLVIFYSFEGNTRFIGEAIAKKVGAEILELKPKKEIRKFLKHFWGGGRVVRGEKPELLPFDKNPQDYDILFIGAPVWALTFAVPLNTFFSKVKLSGKKIALFCCHAGMKGKTLEKMEKSLAGNKILGKIDFIEPLKHQNEKEKNLQRLKTWLESVTASA